MRSKPYYSNGVTGVCLDLLEIVDGQMVPGQQCLFLGMHLDSVNPQALAFGSQQISHIHGHFLRRSLAGRLVSSRNSGVERPDIPCMG
jgi:hypothetical protein